jgi:glycosyltransferase involved in cell wall biosynthesis
VVTVHDLAFERFPEQYPAAKQRYLRLMTRIGTRRATKVIAVSRATGRDLVELYGVPQLKIEVIPNGLSAGFGRPTAAALEQFRVDRVLPPEFFLFVGTLQPRKNLETLLRAYALVCGQTDWPLIVVGAAGWLYDPVFHLVRQLGIGERVQFIGYAPGEELPYLYSAASVFVLPSRYEGFGLPVLEAMACGTPVVTSDRSSLPEVAGDAALLIDPERPQSIADALLRLACDPALRQELAARGLQRAAPFTWRRSAEATLAVYRSMGRR